MKAVSSTAIVLRDEEHWPFIDRADELAASWEALEPESPLAPSRRIRIYGNSGCGKSFFTKEILFRFARRVPDAICLYVEISESNLDSSEIQNKLSLTLMDAKQATRRDPQQVPSDKELAKLIKPLPWWKRWIEPVYTVVKNLVALVPVTVSAGPVGSLGAGPIFGAISSFPIDWFPKRRLACEGRAWEYLSRIAAKTPVVLAVDGIQFLSPSINFELRKLFESSPRGLRLVLVERTENDQIFPALDGTKIRIDAFSDAHADQLLRSILGQSTGDMRAILNNARGNAKQIWFQSRMLATGANSGSVTTNDYHGVISGLPSLQFRVLTLLTLVSQLDDGVIVDVLRMVGYRNISEIRHAIEILVRLGLVAGVNRASDYVLQTDHEIVRRTVRALYTEEQWEDVRSGTLAAFREVLHRRQPKSTGHERLLDGVLTISNEHELLHMPELPAHVDAVVKARDRSESYGFLATLGAQLEPALLSRLPIGAVSAILNAYQKTSNFQQGISLVAQIRRCAGNDLTRTLDLFQAKYHVQLFEYEAARRLLKEVSPGADRDAVEFNIQLNRCEDDEARDVVDRLLRTRDLSIDQCVMLRNAAHLFAEKQALVVLRRALSGFYAHRKLFGEATTLNNIGVAEISAGDIAAGTRSIGEALSGLQRLASNEQYQPLNNLAVVAALNGRLADAKDLLAQARDAVSPWLQMDDIMLTFNDIVLKMLARELPREEASISVVQLYERSIVETSDLRFRWALEWFSLNLRGVPSQRTEFARRFLKSGRIGLEAFVTLDFSGERIEGFLELSPHWRY